MATGGRQCCWRSFMPQFLGQLRVNLCPSAAVGICNKNCRLGLCRSSRELALTIEKASELSLCEFHFKLFGALTVVPTLSTWLGYPPLWRCRQCQCSNAALTRGLQVGFKGACKYVAKPGHPKRAHVLTCDLMCLGVTSQSVLHSPTGKAQCFHNGHGANW